MRQWTTLHKYMWLRILQGANAVYETVKGAIISFVTKKAAPLTELKVEFSPVQDLHGYDSPWPAGGGANKWDEEWEKGRFDTSTGANVSDNNQIRSKGKIPCEPNTQYRFVCPKAVWLIFYDVDDNVIEAPTVPEQAGISGNSVSITANGAFTTPNGAKSLRFYALTSYGGTYNHDIAINYPSSVTTYSPYSNECPITGWTGATAWQTNANLAFVDADHVNVYAGSGTVSDGVVASAGDATRIGVVFSVTPNTEYSLTFTRTAGGTSYYYIYEYSGWPSTVATNRIRTIKGETGQSSNTKINQGFTTGAGAKYVALVFYKSYSALDYSYDDICLKLGANNYDVVDHTGRTISITFPAVGKNIFGGTLKNGHVNFPTVAGQTYTASAQKIDPSVDTYCYVERAVAGTEDFSLVGRIIAGNNVKPITFTAEAGYDYSIYCNSSFTNVKELQIERGSSATAYEPYTNTVYSATIDLITGNGEITGVKYVVDESITNIYAYGRPTAVGGVYFNKSISPRSAFSASQIPQAKIQEKYSHGAIENPYDHIGNFAWVFNSSSTVTTLRIGFADASINTVDALKAFIAENGNLEIYYPLATPIPFHIDPQTINALKGDNTMWANTNGDIEATYRSN